MPIQYLEGRSSSRMFAQEDQYSCGAACARQLLADDGIVVTEQAVRSQTGFVANEGIRATQLAWALSQLSGRAYVGAVPDLDAAQFRSFIKKGTRIVMLRTHWVIADGITEDGLVSVRDPEPAEINSAWGVEGLLGWEAFFSLMKEGQYQVVWCSK